jgi:gamma-tubulin complex component 4
MQCKKIPFLGQGSASSSSSTPSSLGNNAALRSLWHLRNRMAFIVNNLQYYFHVDVLEVQHHKLIQFLERPDINDFEKARQAHEDYLETLLGQCFLQVPAISRCLNQILALCSTYCSKISMGDERFLGIPSASSLPGNPQGALGQALGEGQVLGQEVISREFDKQASLLAAMLAGVRMSSASASLAQIINSEKYSRLLTAKSTSSVTT